MEIFSPIESIIEDVKKGIPVVLVDDENRENEGDLVFSASLATREWVKFLVNECRGLICTPMTKSIAEKLELPVMVENNTESHQTAFTISVDADESVTTGISVDDRLKTILTLGNSQTKPLDLRRPGHIFPLIAKDGGTLVRQGHTEGSVDLMKMAGLYEVAVICELLNLDGTMARLTKDLVPFAKKHNFKIGTIEQIKQAMQK